jgi:hypothetical protein
MRKIFVCFFSIVTVMSFGQVQRNLVEVKSLIREQIILNQEFNFFRDWNTVAVFKSGVGESIQTFPVKFSSVDGKTQLHGLQMYAFIKPEGTIFKVGTNYSGIAKENKNLVQRSVFIDKDDVGRMITFIERDVIPNLKTTYKKQSKEYVYKCRELFFSFLIDEKDLRITFHLVDYGPNGNGAGTASEQVEFWTESQVDEIPAFLKAIKESYAKMK